VGNIARAGELLKAAVTEHPKDGRAYVRLASWELNQNRPIEAGKYAAQAAQLGLESRDLKLIRGLVARQLKEYEHAERFFDAIYRESPGDSEAANQLALALAEQPQAEKQQRALQLAETLVRQFPQSADALATLGWVNYKLGRNGQAEQYLRLSTSGGSLKNDSAYFLARVLAEKGVSDDATKAQEILRAMLDKPGTLFVTRDEAREWLAKISPPPVAKVGKEEVKRVEKAGEASDLEAPEKSEKKKSSL
jgi:tetratricopeptide (TPR) repeat protein